MQQTLTADDINRAVGFGQDEAAVPVTAATAPLVAVDAAVEQAARAGQAAWMREQADQLTGLADYQAEQARVIGRNAPWLADRFAAAGKQNRKLAVAIREQAAKVAQG